VEEWEPFFLDKTSSLIEWSYSFMQNQILFPEVIHKPFFGKNWKSQAFDGAIQGMLFPSTLMIAMVTFPCALIGTAIGKKL
jgi:hypothetical protein